MEIKKNTRKSKGVLFGLICMIFMSQITYAGGSQTPTDTEIITFFETYMLENFDDQPIPGAAIAVVSGDRIIFKQGYGYSNLEEQIKIDTESSVFRVASVSKVVTILSLLDMVDKGLIDLHEDINTYIVDFEVPNQFNTPIEIHHIMTHTDGFGTRDINTFFRSKEHFASLNEIVRQEITSPVEEPGTCITYGAYGTAVAGVIIEYVSGKSFNDYVTENIFEPLNMNDSSFEVDYFDRLGVKGTTVYNYEEDTDTYIPLETMYMQTPSTGGMGATVGDMANIIIALLNEGKLDGQSVLSEEIVERMLTTQYTTLEGFPGVTYGFMEYMYNGERALLRDGSGAGVMAQYFILPEHDLGYFYVQNTRGEEYAYDMLHAFMDTFSESTPMTERIPIDNQSIGGHYTAVQHNDFSISRVEGLLLGEIDVTINEDDTITLIPLGMGDVYGALEGPTDWVQVEPNIFRRIDEERYIAFEVDEKGTVTHMHSGSGYHGSYEKISFLQQGMVQLSIMVVCISLLLIASIILIIKLFRFRKMGGILSEAKGELLIVATTLFISVGFLGTLYHLFIKQIKGFPAFAFGITEQAFAMMVILHIGLIGMVASIMYTTFMWIKVKGSIRERIFYTCISMLLIIVVLWLDTWNFIFFRY